jgi:hypothetical protein
VIFFASFVVVLRELCSKLLFLTLMATKLMKAKFGLCLILSAAITIGIPPRAESQNSNPAFDIVITNGHVIDGTGSPWYSGDVGIREGRIAAIP